MARYIDAEALTDHMLERYNDLCDKHGDWDHYATGYGDAIDAIENAPEADVVPKSEYEAVVSAVDNSTKEFLKLHDDYQEQKVEIEALRGAANSYKMHYENLAREIFEEIEQCIAEYGTGRIFMGVKFAELKKKYTENME